MHEAGFFADMFGKVGQKGDDIMLCLALNLVDTVNFERTTLPHGGSGFGGYDAQFCLCITGMCLNLKPYLKLAVLGPD
jgi:hypothetical protein